MINKDRFLAITDAIIAVAATVMVLRLDIPEKVTLDAMQDRLPVLTAYIVSYIQIFLAWHEHHDTFVKAEKIDHRIFLVNTVWLFFITMMPFVTGVMGTSPHHAPSVLLYLLVLVLQSGVLAAECRMVEKLNGIEIQDSMIIRRIRKITLIACVLAAVIAFFQPMAGVAVVIAVSVISVIMVVRYDISVSKKGGN